MELPSSPDQGIARLPDHRVAFFGGSFDPPHCGHLAIARAAQAALNLDAVLFAPVGAQPLKPFGSSASFPDRVAMTRLAIAGDPSFAVSLVDAPTPTGTPNYTIDTLIHFRAELPFASTLYFLMGADSFLSIGRWHRAAEIPFVASIVVASRPGQPLVDLKAALPSGLRVSSAAIPAQEPLSSSVEENMDQYLVENGRGESAPLFILPALRFDVSASQIRERIHAPNAPRPEDAQLLSAAVLTYIRAHHLYR
jgi:nicotinate-nucleotide adenylyltransferase